MTTWSVRTELFDGTTHYEHAEDEKRARDAYSAAVRNARSAVRRIELRRRDDDGTHTIVSEKEGAWA